MTQKVVLICFVCLMGALGVAGASDSQVEKELPAVFDHLEEMVTTHRGIPDAQHLDSLLTFLDEKHTPGTVWEESRNKKRTGVGVTFAIPVSFLRFVRYMYDPELPVSAVVPGVVRLVREVEGDHKGAYAEFRTEEGGRQAPVLVRSRHIMEITPDDTSGAYYGYDQNELTLLSSWRGRRFILTASHQVAPSEVGKKGYPVITRDGGTIYCYSGKKGLTKRGLGWVNSYIYTSLAITVYLEDAPGSDSLTAISCKWLNAGWLGKNMVRPHHISSGINRFAEHLVRFLTAPNVPEPSELVALTHRLDTGEEAALKDVLAIQLDALLDPGQKNATMMNRSYVERLDHEELVAGILSNYVASLLAGGDSAFLKRLMAGVGEDGGATLLTGEISPLPTQIAAGDVPVLN